MQLMGPSRNERVPDHRLLLEQRAHGATWCRKSLYLAESAARWAASTAAWSVAT